MSFLNSVLKAFVGDKKSKDLKELQPLVDQVRSYDKAMEGLSIEELRQKTTDFKKQIAEAIKPFGSVSLEFSMNFMEISYL
jgi:preprotein translocase subunit SecA